ncbi:MAG: hypothetical protein AXW16_06530 [Cycloclasticus sp. Phe_18]|jgi:hypothetical protein|nr:MAG: hypothetical protein AXW16_06530 [Cycloclasticus sp. Phe_18]
MAGSTTLDLNLLDSLDKTNEIVITTNNIDTLANNEGAPKLEKMGAGKMTGVLILPIPGQSL